MGRVDERLIACEAREAELRKALGVAFEMLTSLLALMATRGHPLPVSQDKLTYLKQALSNGKAAMQKQLDEVVRVLKVLKSVEWAFNANECPVCGGSMYDTFHTETCELALLIKDLETKRDSLAEAIKGVG